MPKRKPICSKCGFANDRPAQRYCAGCHAEYMRAWRKTHPLNQGQKSRDRARSVAFFHKKRGGLAPQPCQACGDRNTEMHHPDYEQPLTVTWLCRPCHLAWHSFSRATILETFGFWLASMQPAHKRSAA